MLYSILFIVSLREKKISHFGTTSHRLKHARSPYRLNVSPMS